MKGRRLATVLVVAAAAGAAAGVVWLRRPGVVPGGPSSAPPDPDSGFVDPRVCQPCHADLYRTYRKTGMGRSLYRLTRETADESWTERNTFHHAASDRDYTMLRRGARFFQRRHQIDPGGGETNVVEKEVQWVLGSGNHARSYLHLDSAGRLFQLPITWYREKGGAWAMSPGYDRPVHHDFRRRITYECLFCHTGYPPIERGADSFGRESLFRRGIPEGIDCQRCHGPGRAHVEAAGTPDANADAVRRSIVNPARLSRERQLEVCMQCHLQTTSTRLPPFIHRFGRGLLSYRPGEPLADYILHFDHAPGAGHDDKFEIVSAPYRLRRSACFRRSGGALTCTTCHDPHDIPRGEAAARHYGSVCQGCHASAVGKLVAAGRHPKGDDCAACHMPKRRTEDVVHVVMTDHWIARPRPGRDLLAPLDEKRFYDASYRGEVVPYHPADLASAPDGELYLAIAQVRDGSNRKAGLARLERALAARAPHGGEAEYELGRAYAEEGEHERAAAAYERALARRPDLWVARERLALALLKLGRNDRAAVELEQAARLGVEEATTLGDLALAYRNLGRIADARRALERAVAIDAESAEAHNNLGGLLLETGEPQRAETEFREAIRLQPDFAGAHRNLARALAGRSAHAAAELHFEKAIALDPNLVEARHDYALMLVQLERYDRAQSELEAAVRLEPRWAEAHARLGDVLLLRGSLAAAIRSYRQAVELDPSLHRAHLDLGTALVLARQIEPARVHFRKAAESSDPELRREAEAALARAAAAARR